MKNFILLLSFIFCVSSSVNAFAQQEEQQFSEAELAQMLAPIALYPDSLLTHILIASTYPIEIVEAHRWLKKNENLSAENSAKLVENFDWDESVKALVPFEKVLSRLSEDLSWTQQLGDAFLQDEAKLLESIQVLREQAKLAGNLEKMDNMDVSYEENNIIIEPREKEIVYVPYYDTRMVYGNWHWSSYPPVYWTPFHRVHVSHYSPFYWHSGIHISFNYFFSAFHWHNRHVMVVTPHHSRHRYYHQRPRRLTASGGYAKRWSHQPSHRKGVAYSSQRTHKKYHSNRVSIHKNSKQLHQSLKKNGQRHAKQRVSLNNHASKKGTAIKGHHRNKMAPSAKPNLASTKHQAQKQKKVYQSNVRSNKATVKSHNKSHNKNRNSSINKRSHAVARKDQSHVRSKQKHRSMTAKSRSSKAERSRNK